MLEMERNLDNRLNDNKNLSKEKKLVAYQNWDLELMETSYKLFCQNCNINYKYAKEIGTKRSKKILREYFTDELDGNLSKEVCDHLYTLLEDPWDCSQLMRHKILADLVSYTKSNKTKEKILILGAGLGGEYNHLRNVYPEANYYITDITKNALNSFRKKYKHNLDYITHILDAFTCKSLFEFTSEYGKFDLVIASGVYRYAPNESIRRKSARFIYKHYLKNDGMFCIVEVRQDPKYDNPLLLKGLEPIVNKIFQTKTRINPTHFVFYSKKDRGVTLK